MIINVYYFFVYYSYVRKILINLVDVEYPLPPKCIISVYGSSAHGTESSLHYAIPLKGVVLIQLLYIIHRSLRTATTTSSGKIVLTVITHLIYCSIATTTQDATPTQPIATTTQPIAATTQAVLPLLQLLLLVKVCFAVLLYLFILLCSSC